MVSISLFFRKVLCGVLGLQAAPITNKSITVKKYFTGNFPIKLINKRIPFHYNKVSVITPKYPSYRGARESYF